MLLQQIIQARRPEYGSSGVSKYTKRRELMLSLARDTIAGECTSREHI
jgi:hypothetical protein